MLTFAVIMSLVTSLMGAVPVAAADRKPPRIARAVMVDADGNGKVDRIVLTYSEAVRHKADKDGKYPFTVKGYKIRSVGRAKGAKLTLRVKEAAGPAKPTIVYKRSARQAVKDRAGNQAVKQRFTKVVPLPVVVPEGSSQLTVNPEGPGRIVSDDGLIACESSCSAVYSDGKSVTLTAVPSMDAVFLGWTGACEGTDVACTVVVDQDQTVRATFGWPVTVGVSGDGSVSSGDGRIACPDGCSAVYEAGSPLALTAAAPEGTTFAGWSGDCSGTADCSLKVNGPVNVQATFEPADPDPSPLPTVTPVPLPTVTVPPLP